MSTMDSFAQIEVYLIDELHRTTDLSMRFYLKGIYEPGVASTDLLDLLRLIQDWGGDLPLDDIQILLMQNLSAAERQRLPGGFSLGLFFLFLAQADLDLNNTSCEHGTQLRHFGALRTRLLDVLEHQEHVPKSHLDPLLRHIQLYALSGAHLITRQSRKEDNILNWLDALLATVAPGPRLRMRLGDDPAPAWTYRLFLRSERTRPSMAHIHSIDLQIVDGAHQDLRDLAAEDAAWMPIAQRYESSATSLEALLELFQLRFSSLFSIAEL